jgi:hypothetical protein
MKSNLKPGPITLQFQPKNEYTKEGRIKTIQSLIKKELRNILKKQNHGNFKKNVQ